MVPPRSRLFGGFFRRARRLVWRLILLTVVLLVSSILMLRSVNPVTTPYMSMEARRLGGVDHEWVAMDGIAPVMARAVVAAEDANFCNHFGFDMAAIRAAVADGGARGASTISQQTVKNLFLWQGRSWSRKAVEAVLTPLIEALWSKKRILEVYLNVVEFDEGVFGVDAAAHKYFGTTPDKLTATQAARLAAVLPSPKTRNAAKPSAGLRKRAAAILDGAATLRADGRSACFEG